jgi:hypothetical protein
MVSLGSVGENFIVNPPESQFQAQHTSMNLLMKSGLLDKKPAKKFHVLTEAKVDEVRARLECTPQKSLRCVA